jgi:3-oxoacyl-[acyl-carrier-protein] synthase-3
VDRAETTTDLAVRASREALGMAGVSPAELDLIIVGTVTPDRQFPSAGCEIQMTLDAANAAAYDVSAGCTGFLYALNNAYNAMKTGTAEKALVIGVERLSSVLNWEDRGTCVLLADGAGALVLGSRPEEGGILSTHIRSDGHFGELLYSYYGSSTVPEILEGLDTKPFQIYMNGNRLFRKAIECLSDISREALEKNNLTTKDIDAVVPHQANIRIIQGLAKSLKIPLDRFCVNIQKYGNTSSGTVPIALDEACRDGRFQKGDHILLASFGAGLTWGSAMIEWTL